MTIEMLVETLRGNPSAVEQVVSLKGLLANMTEDEIRALVPEAPVKKAPKKFAEMTADEKIERLAAVVRDLDCANRATNAKMQKIHNMAISHVHAPDGKVATLANELYSYTHKIKVQRDPNYDPLDVDPSLRGEKMQAESQNIGGMFGEFSVPTCEF